MRTVWQTLNKAEYMIIGGEHKLQSFVDFYIISWAMQCFKDLIGFKCSYLYGIISNYSLCFNILIIIGLLLYIISY